MPGRLYSRLDRYAPKRCPECRGADLGAVGVIHHQSWCPRRPCFHCGLEVMPGERRTWVNGSTAHLQCVVDFEYARDQDGAL